MYEVTAECSLLCSWEETSRTKKVALSYTTLIATVLTMVRTVLSSLARRPGSWVRIPLRAWMYDVCAFFCVCVVLCLGRGLATS
jgi:hypothetical protein